MILPNYLCMAIMAMLELWYGYVVLHLSITAKAGKLISANGKVYLMQPYVIKFLSDL
jgi:hypothetical protein